MKRGVLVFLIGCLTLVLAFTTNALADVVITYEISNAESKEIPSGSVIKISLSERNLRWDMADLVSMIYRKDDSFLIIDHKERFFLDVGRMVKMLERMQKEMESQLAQVPPEQRKMMEAMMGRMIKQQMREQQMTEPCEDPRVIKDERVNGIPAKVVDGCKTIVNGRWQSCRFWFADAERLGLKQDDLRLFSDFMEYQKKALSRVSSFAGQRTGISFSYHPAREKVLNLPYKLPFVVKMATVENEEERMVIILKDIRFGKVPDRVFMVPQGYKDKTPKMTGDGGVP